MQIYKWHFRTIALQTCLTSRRNNATSKWQFSLLGRQPLKQKLLFSEENQGSKLHLLLDMHRKMSEQCWSAMRWKQFGSWIYVWEKLEFDLISFFFYHHWRQNRQLFDSWRFLSVDLNFNAINLTANTYSLPLEQNAHNCFHTTYVQIELY